MHGWNGVGCGRPVRVPSRPGETLTGSACMADLTVQDYRRECLREHDWADVVLAGGVSYCAPWTHWVKLSFSCRGEFDGLRAIGG